MKLIAPTKVVHFAKASGLSRSIVRTLCGFWPNHWGSRKSIISRKVEIIDGRAVAVAGEQPPPQIKLTKLKNVWKKVDDTIPVTCKRCLKIMEDDHDRSVIEQRRNEPTITSQQLKEQLL